MMHPLISQRIFNTPLALHPLKAEVISRAFLDASFSKDIGSFNSVATQEREYGYDIIEGFAVIPVHGTLVQKSAYLEPTSGFTGYNSIRQNLHHAVLNPKVQAIVFDIDSGGGEVAGCFDLVDDIYNLRDEKPMTAILNESAYSAAYAIASAAHRVTVPRTGGVGSVGVICMHADYSAAIKDAGIKITVIKYGDKKGDGMAEVKLSGSALEKLQNDVDTMGELFVETVARNRGLGVSKVRGMQAACYLGKEGVDIGLADDIITPHLEFKNSIDAINS